MRPRGTAQKRVGLLPLMVAELLRWKLGNSASFQRANDRWEGWDAGGLWRGDAGDLGGRREAARVGHPTLNWDEDAAVLIDAGFPGQLDLLRAGIQKAGVPLDRLGAVIMTHQDLDHIGSLPGFVKVAPPGLEVLASEAEKPFIEGERRLLRYTPEAIDQMIESLPTETLRNRNAAQRRPTLR